MPACARSRNETFECTSRQLCHMQKKEPSCALKSHKRIVRFIRRSRKTTHDVADAADVNRRIVFSTFVRRCQITGTSFHATEVLAFFFSFLFPPSRNYATPLLFIRTGENMTNADPKAAEKIYSIKFFKPQGPPQKSGCETRIDPEEVKASGKKSFVITALLCV